MIELTRFSGAAMVLSADLIETVEATPDTVITLTSGRKLLVKEPVDEVVRRVIEFRRGLARRRGPCRGGGTAGGRKGEGEAT